MGTKSAARYAGSGAASQPAGRSAEQSSSAQGAAAMEHRHHILPTRIMCGQLRLLRRTPGRFMRNGPSLMELRLFSS